MYAADAVAPLAKEQFLHSVLNESVTSYLNALLNAKNSNQLVIMSSEPGVPELAGWACARIIAGNPGACGLFQFFECSESCTAT